MPEWVTCPHCGELNDKGSKICSACRQKIEGVINADWQDEITTIREEPPKKSSRSDKVMCPHCGEPNVLGSNICGGCLRSIREVGNPEREDFFETKWQPPTPPGVITRIKRWWWGLFNG
jgi:hypothetical protein